MSTSVSPTASFLLTATIPTCEALRGQLNAIAEIDTRLGACATYAYVQVCGKKNTTSCSRFTHTACIAGAPILHERSCEAFVKDRTHSWNPKSGPKVAQHTVTVTCSGSHHNQ